MNQRFTPLNQRFTLLNRRCQPFIREVLTYGISWDLTCGIGGGILGAASPTNAAASASPLPGRPPVNPLRGRPMVNPLDGRTISSPLGRSLVKYLSS